MSAIVFIPLTQGKVAVIDFEDFEKVSGFKWCAHKQKNTFYAVRGIRRPDGTKTLQRMHHFLLGGRADHIDGNGLDNRKTNIRLASPQQNIRAFGTKSAGCSSEYRGVCRHKPRNKWTAQIHDGGKKKHLGCFASEVEAARAYDAAALARDPNFHNLNFPVNK